MSISTVVAAAVRGGLALMAVTSFADAAIVASSGGNAPLVLVGLALTGLAIGGLWHAASVATLLRPRGRIAVPIALLALAGVDPGFQDAYGNIVFAVICLAAVVASPRWVAVCVALCLLGFVAHWAVQGHSAHWMFFGAGRADLARHTVDLVLYACVMLGAITILRRSLAGAPADLARTRAGADSLTPQLAAAVRTAPAGLLPRADPVALADRLSVSERHVLALLANGLAPKQAARELGVAVPTVRSHIAAAKRKTGARTLEQLVGLFAEAQHGA